MESIKSDNQGTRENLTRVIKNYRQNRERLVKIQSSTKKAFDQITEILKSESESLLDCVDSKNLNHIAIDLGSIETPDVLVDENFYLKSVFDKQVEIGNPAIAVVGQVKSGKSTFVNTLLRKNVVSQAFERCTARITRVTYSEKNFVEIINNEGIVLKKKLLKSTTIPKRFLQLEEKDRIDEEEINKQIRAGIHSDFLKCGIDIIDSPGLSENETLNNLSKSMIKSILPVMIYVIDGRTSVKETDISDLLELKNAVPNLQIIYFVTKLDTDDSNETENSDPIKLAELKMEIAFKKLQFNNFIPSTYSHWSECSYFHGCSLYAFMDYFQKPRTPEVMFHYNLFSKFEENLHHYLLINFRNKIEEVCNFLIDFQMEVMAKIINRAQMLSDFSRINVDEINRIKSIEEKLYKKIKSAVKDSKTYLKSCLIKRLKDEFEAIVTPISEIIYPNHLNISSDGIVSDNIKIEQCQKIIISNVCQGLENVIKRFVEEELFQKYLKAIEAQIPFRMKDKLSVTKSGKTNYGLCLDRRMAEIYKFNISNNLSNLDGNNTIMKFMNVILFSVKGFLLKGLKIEFSHKSINVKDPKWKLKQAKKCLRRCDYNNLADEVCKSLLDEFYKKHNEFTEVLNLENSYVQKKIEISDEIRQTLSEKAPTFASFIMLSLDVKGKYFLQNVEEKESIGSGSQGTIYRCVCSGKELAEKKYIVNIELIEDIAEEIYYSYSFEHPHLLPFIAVAIKDTKEKNIKEVSIYSPLMKIDLYNYLCKNKTKLNHRIAIAIQIAEALQYLHSHNIMHRDLKLANILLDEDNNVFLADYGFCKSTALTRYSFVGTPLHIAPEIIRKDNYDYKVDIYSFAILLWFLSEGTGRSPKMGKGYQKIITIDMRPERLENISVELWNLIEACWNENPVKRPNSENVIDKLNYILKTIE